jgi:hypothetical protein
MSDHVNIAARVRAGNPLPGTPAVSGPAAVLERIVATPRDASPRRPRATPFRRPLLALSALLLLACGIALAAGITVRYFSETGSKPLPPAVREALERATHDRSPTDRLALANTVTAYVLTSAHGRSTVYMAPFARLAGFCAALAVAGEPVQASCVSTSGAIATVAGDYGQPWDIRLSPDVHAILGRLAPSAAGDRVVITFEDGTTEDAPMRGRWFAYAVAGKQTHAGHRPSQLTVVRDGRVIRRRALEPTAFNTLAAARALVPASDGSRGQDAMRHFLLDGLSQRLTDGGALASATDVAGTRSVASLTFGGAGDVTVYAAPVRPTPSLPGGGSIILGIGRGSDRAIVAFSGVGGPRRPAFGLSGGCVCALPGHPAATYDLLVGSVPLGATRVAVRTFDGATHAATVFAAGSLWIWVGHDRPAGRPIRLIARDAAGAVVTTRPLHGKGGFGR